MCRATVEALAVPAVQDRALAALAEHEVDRAGHPWHEGNDRRLVAFADDAQCSMASIKAEIFRVGRTGLAHSESIQAEEHRQGGMVTVVPLGGEEEGAQLSAVEAPTFARVDLGTPDVLGRIRADPPVNVSEAVVAADGRESSVNGRGGQATLLAGRPPQLDIGTLGLEHRQPDASAPLEVAAQVEAVRLESPPAVASEECRCRHVRFLKRAVGGTHQLCGIQVHCGHRSPPGRQEENEYLVRAHCSRAE
jgi:hypothetical protein